jgi:hypothetical protein
MQKPSISRHSAAASDDANAEYETDAGYIATTPVGVKEPLSV